MQSATRTFRRSLTLAILLNTIAAAQYYPPPDSEGGWRRLTAPSAIRDTTGIDFKKLDEAFEFSKRMSKNGGLLVARNGWLVYENYFGQAHRDATANTGSVGKSFTSAALGILLNERPEVFPDGLDQRIYASNLMPSEAFPIPDQRRAAIRLGHLLSMTAGIRGNNPGMVRGKPVTLDPPGPDGWLAMDDAMAFGHMPGDRNTRTLWCEPGEGYSYATSSIHLASVVLRHVAGVELEEYVREKLAGPMGWGHWGWGYKNHPLNHTAGGGGIAPRPTDMLRFCYLLLRKGRWNDRQLIPAAYVQQCGTSSPYNPHSNYSLQFHVNADGAAAGVPRDAFWKPGSGGHGIYIIPSLDLVFFKMGGRDGQFSPENTGVPPSLERPPSPDPSRADWSASYGDENPYETLMRMVVASVVQR